MATLFLGPLGNDRDSWEKRLTVHRTGYPIHSTTDLLFCWSTFQWAFTWDTVSSYPSPIRINPSTFAFPQCLSHQFFNHSSQVSDYLDNPLASTQKSVNNSISGHFSFQTNVWPCIPPEVLSAHCEDYPSLVSFRVGSEGVAMLQLSTSGWCLHSVQDHQ